MLTKIYPSHLLLITVSEKSWGQKWTHTLRVTLILPRFIFVGQKWSEPLLASCGSHCSKVHVHKGSILHIICIGDPGLPCSSDGKRIRLRTRAGFITPGFRKIWKRLPTRVFWPVHGVSKVRHNWNHVLSCGVGDFHLKSIHRSLKRLDLSVLQNVISYTCLRVEKQQERSTIHQETRSLVPNVELWYELCL